VSQAGGCGVEFRVRAGQACLAARTALAPPATRELTGEGVQWRGRYDGSFLRRRTREAGARLSQAQPEQQRARRWGPSGLNPAAGCSGGRPAMPRNPGRVDAGHNRRRCCTGAPLPRSRGASEVRRRTNWPPRRTRHLRGGLRAGRRPTAVGKPVLPARLPSSFLLSTGSW